MSEALDSVAIAVYGAAVSKDTSPRSPTRIEEMTEWSNRPLESLDPVIFIDAIRVSRNVSPIHRQMRCPAAGNNTAAGGRQERVRAVPGPRRRDPRVRGHFPTEQAAMKCLYLSNAKPDPPSMRQSRT